VELGVLQSVLTTLRRTVVGPANLREPITSWARERGLPV
jgi:hypothetical protein